jgi:hypothetical protein
MVASSEQGNESQSVNFLSKFAIITKFLKKGSAHKFNIINFQ